MLEDILLQDKSYVALTNPSPHFNLNLSHHSTPPNNKSINIYHPNKSKSTPTK